MIQIRKNTISFVAILSLSTTFILSGCSAQPEQTKDLQAIQLVSPNPSALIEPDLPESESNSPVTDSFAELEIEDQSGNGLIVEIEEVKLSLGLAFLVITKLDGTFLGYSTATPDSQPVKVFLTSELTSSQELVGMLFLDNGDGAFSTETDSRIQEEESEFVEEDFYYTYRKD